MKNKRKRVIEEYEEYKAAYLSIQKEVTETNLNTLKIFSVFGVLLFLMMTISGFFRPELKAYINIYIGLFVVSIIVFMLSSNLKEVTTKKVRTYMYLFIFCLWIAEIAFSTIVEPNDVTVSYIVLIIAVPLIFIENRLVLGSLIIFSDIVYIAIAYNTQAPEIFEANLTNIIPFTLLSILISSFVVGAKIKGIEYKHELDIIKKKEELEKERDTNRKSFVSDMIKFASQKESAELIIDECLQYMTKTFNLDHAFIFEDNGDGTYSNTYEYCNKGVTSNINSFKNLPFKGFVDSWVKELDSNKSIQILDIESYKQISETTYNILKPISVERLIVAPIIIEEKIVGFYGGDNMPLEVVKDITETIEMMDFVISMLIKLRNDRQKIEYNATHDALTDCKNRSALAKLYSYKYEHIAVAEYDLNGLKRINDNQGHEAGDAFIIDIANILKSVFGKEKIYRTGGDEFYIIDIVSSKEDFENKLNKCTELVKDRGSCGYIFKYDNQLTIQELMKMADEKMYAAKNLYYRTSGLERRAR